jgi:hypothetical protein
MSDELLEPLYTLVDVPLTEEQQEDLGLMIDEWIRRTIEASRRSDGVYGG